MLLTTILNQCYRFKGFVYGQARFVRHRGRQSIEVGVRTARIRLPEDTCRCFDR